MRVAFVYAPGRLARWEATRTGRAASEFYYGAAELARRGHETAVLEPATSVEAGWASWLLDALFRWQLLPARTTGTVLAALDALRGEINRAEVVVGTNTAAAYGLGVLRLAGRIRPQVIGIHCGLVNFAHSRRRRFVNGVVLRRTWTQLFGEGELSQVRSTFRVPAARVEVNQFGVDTRFWAPVGAGGEYVLAVGNDARRDFDLLTEVARRLPCPVKVITARQRPDRLPPNVEWLRGSWRDAALTDQELRALYQGARLVVIPLRDSPQPSGQSVCLQAMACGKPVVLTDTRGLWSREMMRDGDNVVLVRPGDATELAAAIMRLWTNEGIRETIGRAARDTACREGNIELFADRLERLCSRLMPPTGVADCAVDSRLGAGRFGAPAP